MARPLRIQFPGAFYHITSRGNERKDIFKSRADREKFLSYLESVVLRYQAVIHVYCLMSNHFHLLLETPSGNLSAIMRHINGSYTTYYNIKRARSGHLFQGRFKALLVDADAYAKELSRYIHLNPVRAGIVKTASDYQWSSYCAYSGAAISPKWLYRDFILGYFGGVTAEAQKRYSRFVWENEDDSEPKNPFADVVASTFLGGKEFIDKICETWLKGKKKDRNLPALKAILGGPKIKMIVQSVESAFGAGTALSKQAALYLCHRYSGKALSKIGRHFGIGESGVSQASRRFSDRLDKDKDLAKKIKKLSEQIKISRM